MGLGWLERLKRSDSLDCKEIVTPSTDATKPVLESQDTYDNYPCEKSTNSKRSFRSRWRRHRRLTIIITILFAAVLSLSLIIKNRRDSHSHKWTPPTRVRRSWKTYTDAEKQHYLSAVQLAMEKGYHYRFVQIHTARMNRITAHDACPFLLWHRRFILGYENMLRSLAPEFANLTLPYWNYFEDTNRQLATDVLCDSLESCSQFLRDMGGGGRTDGPAGVNMTIEHVDLEIGTCVSEGIAGHACNHPNGTASGVCRNCIMRGQWNNPRKIVQTLGQDLLSVLGVFNTTESEEVGEGTYGVLSHAVETTFHNAIHNTLNSTMRYTSSPFDPVFMGHHGMVDLAQLIFNRCKYVHNVSTVIDWEKEKRDKRFDIFPACDVDDNGVYNYTAFGNETMYMTFQDVLVSEDSFMKQFFSGYGVKYSDVASAEDLDDKNRYTYVIDPYLQQLLESHNIRCPPYLYESKSETTAQRRLESTNESDSHRDRVIALDLAKTLANCGDEIVAQHPSISYQDRIQQEGLLKCLVVEEKSGGILDDYDNSFREMMRLSATDAPYCVSLLRRYRSGEVPLLASDECIQKYGNQTGVELHVAATKQ